MMQEALGLVSCCWCPQEGAGLLLPSLHHPASPCGPCPPGLDVTQCEGRWEGSVGAQPTLPGAAGRAEMGSAACRSSCWQR